MASFRENSLVENPLFQNSHPEDVSMEDLISKKVRFREDKEDAKVGADPVMIATAKVSWKDKLIGSSNSLGNGIEEKDDFEILDGDIQRSVVDGTPSIEFSERINQILIPDMENTVVLKLLGRNIGFIALQNKIYSL